MTDGSDVNYWSLVTIVGPLLLLVVIAWAFMRNKKSKVDPKITEEGTHRVYEEEQRIHKRDPGSGL